MIELKQLLRQSSHYLFGLIASLALGFISFPIYTRVFSVADYGLIDFAQKIVLLVVALSKCGLQNSALRFYNREEFAADPGAERRYYSTMFFSVIAPAAAITILFAATIHWAPRSLVDAGLSAVLMMAAGLIFLRAAQSILWSFLRIEERTKAYNVVSLIMRAATIAAVCGLLPVLGASVETYFAATLLVEAVVVALMVIPLFRRGLAKMTHVDSGMARAAFAFGLPLVIQEIAGLILDSGDRLMIRHFLTDYALGLYSVAYGLATYVNTLVMAPLGLAILPIYMKLWNAEGREKTIDFLSQGLDGFLIAAGLIMALAGAGARDAVMLLASSRYAGAERLIPILVAGLLVYTAQIFLNAGLLIHKQTGKMATILGWSAALNMVLNWWLLPRIGLQAAALATLAAYLVCTAWLAWDSFRLLPLRVSVWAMVRYAAASAVAWILAAKIEMGTALGNVCAKCLAVVIVYLLALYLTDSRIRLWTAALWKIAFRKPAEVNGRALAMSAFPE
jgi:O-antigen/teichoic acid export membrane protein